MSHSGDFPVYLILITSIYTIIILILLQKIQWSEVNKPLLVKSLLLIIICSVIITLIINWYFQWNNPWYLFFINTFLWVIGWISLIVYLTKYKKEGWLPLMFTTIPIFATAFMTISAIVFMPTLFNQNNDNTVFEDYIAKNIYGIVYSDISSDETKIIIFVFNNGIEPINKDLQFYIEINSDKYKILKPNDEQNLSYKGEETKPQVTGNDNYVRIVWNQSLPDITLEQKGRRWAVFYLEQIESGSNIFDVVESKSCKVIWDKQYNLNVTTVPWFFNELPQGNPKDWDIPIILEDIDMFGY